MMCCLTTHWIGWASSEHLVLNWLMERMKCSLLLCYLKIVCKGESYCHINVSDRLVESLLNIKDLEKGEKCHFLKCLDKFKIISMAALIFTCIFKKMSWQYLHLLWLCFSTFLFCLSRGCFLACCGKALQSGNGPFESETCHCGKKFIIDAIVLTFLCLWHFCCSCKHVFVIMQAPFGQARGQLKKTPRMSWRLTGLAGDFLP